MLFGWEGTFQHKHAIPLQIIFFFSLKKMSNTMLFIHIAYSKAVFANYTDCDDYSIHYFLLELGETKNKW